MGRECNLELCLVPAGVDATRSSPPDSGESRNGESIGKMQQLTIFYNGRICACQVTELQARAILRLANKEMSERKEADDGEMISARKPNAPAHPLKRSLQQFLQKRKNRIQATSPYNYQYWNGRAKETVNHNF